MAWIRQLPSGLWAATVCTPVGRISDSHELRSVVTKWASDIEADIRRPHATTGTDHGAGRATVHHLPRQADRSTED